MSLERVHIGGPMPLAPRRAISNRYHFEALDEGRLVTRWCGACNAFCFPPLDRCRACGSREVSWREMPGDGTLYASTTLHAVAEGFRPHAPIQVGVIDLHCGVRLLAWLVEAAIPLDTEVRLCALHFDDGTLLGAKEKR